MQTLGAGWERAPVSLDWSWPVGLLGTGSRAGQEPGDSAAERAW